MRYFENEPARQNDPAQNAATIKERFGIPDPREIMAQVDQICDNKLPAEKR